MASLRTLIGKKPKIGTVFATVYVEPPYEGPSTNDTTVDKRKRHYQNLFVAIKKQSGLWAIRGKAMKTCLCKLAEELEQMEAEGRPVNIVDYFEAHKLRYGDKLRPQHLIQEKSLSIYNDFMTQKYAPTFALSVDEEQAYDEETVARLARIRGESKKTVRKMLQLSGLL